MAREGVECQLWDASITLSESPAGLQLRYLQTLLELGADQSSTVVFPIPHVVRLTQLDIASRGFGAGISVRCARDDAA